MKNKTSAIRIGIFLATILIVTTPVYAAAVFGTVNGPVWTQPGYRFTVPVTELTNPDKSVCLAYSVNGTPQTPVSCTCSGANCSSGPGTYTCNMPSPSSATIAWDISSYTANNGCTGKSIQGPFGSFTTGPTAVSLASFDAQPHALTWLLPIGLLLALGAFLLMIRRRA